jgi:flavin reductase (DIM6/NTAB) family NADH-FMN oxidoreductase RutF
MKKQLGPSDVIFPVPAALVVSGCGEAANILTIAWIGILSSTPPTIGISLHQRRYSLGLIRENQEFTVNFPSAGQFREVDYCGITSGRKHHKAKELGFTLLPGAVINTPIIQECPYNIECKVTQEIELGEYTLFMAEIVETHVDEAHFDPTNRANINIASLDPLAYCAVIREYWRLGEKLGKGFDAGRTILDAVQESESPTTAT